MSTPVASLFAKISADVGDFEKGMKGVKSDLLSAEKGFASFQNVAAAGLKAVGLAAGAAFAGLAAGVGASIKAATDFEQNIADVGAVMSLTSGQTADLQKHIMDLGLDPNLKVSATQATDAVMSLGTAGLNMTQIMGGASEATVLLANATGGDMASSATLMTDVMAQYGIAAGDTSRIVDQLTGLTVASKFSFEDAALAFGQVGGVAGSVGLSLEDTNAILGTTAFNFNSGSDAATSMKTFLQRLIPTTNEAEDALDQLGIMAGGNGVSGAFFTASGAMRTAEEIAGNLQSAFSGLSDAQRIEAASTIFGTDAMRTALALVEGGTPAITKFKDEVAKVDAGEMASKRMNTFAGAIEIAQGVIETISISIGQQFLPVLRPLVERFTELAQTHGPKLIDVFGKFAEKMAFGFQVVMDWTTKGLGPLWEKMQQVGTAINTVTGIVMKALSPITSAIGKWVSWQDILLATAAVLTGAVALAIAGFIGTLAPAILLVAKVTAVIVALKAAWQTNFLGIQDITESVLDRISGWLKVYTGVWKGDWGKTLKFFTENSREAWNNLADSVVSQFRSWTNEVRHIVATWVKETVDKFEYWNSKIYFGIQSWSVDVMRVVKSWRDNIVDRFESVFEWWDKHIKPFTDKGRDIVQGLWDGMKEVWGRFMNWWNSVWGKNLTKTVEVKMETHSPSKVMERLGMNVMEGFGLGAERMLPYVQDVMGAIPAASITAGQYAAHGGSSGGYSSEDTALLQRNNDLLTILIQELRNKSLSVTVAGGGSGGGFGQLVTHVDGLRR